MCQLLMLFVMHEFISCASLVSVHTLKGSTKKDRTEREPLRVKFDIQIKISLGCLPYYTQLHVLKKSSLLFHFFLGKQTVQELQGWLTAPRAKLIQDLNHKTKKKNIMNIRNCEGINVKNKSFSFQSEPEKSCCKNETCPEANRCPPLNMISYQITKGTAEI